MASRGIVSILIEAKDAATAVVKRALDGVRGAARQTNAALSESVRGSGITNFAQATKRAFDGLSTTTRQFRENLRAAFAPGLTGAARFTELSNGARTAFGGFRATVRQFQQDAAQAFQPAIASVRTFTSAVLTQGRQAFQGLTASFRGIGVATTGALGVAVAALGAFVAKVTQVAAAYDTAVRRMRAASPALAADIQVLTKEIDILGATTGQTRAQLIAAAEEMARTGVASAEEAAQRLRRASQLADASGADLVRVIQGLDLVADAFGLSSNDAADALDQIFAATRGKVGLESVLEVMEQGASVLASFGVRAAETGEALGALLDAGVTSRQAGTVLIGLLEKVESIAKKTTAATKEEKEAIEAVQRTFSQTAIQSTSFTAALGNLNRAVNGSVTALQLAGFSAQEANAIVRVTANVTDQAATSSEKLAAAQRAVAEAATLNRGSADALNKMLRNELDATLTRLGNFTLPLFTRVLRGTLDLFDSTGAAARRASQAIEEFSTRRADLSTIELTRVSATHPLARLPGLIASGGGTAADTLRTQIDQIVNAFEKSGDRIFEALGIRELGNLASNFTQFRDAGVGAGVAFEKTYAALIDRLKEVVIAEGQAKAAGEEERKARENAQREFEAQLRNRIRLEGEATEAQLRDARIRLLELQLETGRLTGTLLNETLRLEAQLLSALGKKNLSKTEELELEQDLLRVAKLRAQILAPGGAAPAVGRDLRSRRELEAAQLGAVPFVRTPTIEPQAVRIPVPTAPIPPATRRVDETERLADVLSSAIDGPLTEFFSTSVRGIKDLGEASRGFAQAVLQSLQQIAAQRLTTSILDFLLPKAASGAFIRGPGGPTADRIPILVSSGEAVLNARTVQALGGEPAINYLNQLGAVPPLPRPTVSPVVTQGLSEGRRNGADVPGTLPDRESRLLLMLDDGLVLRQMDTAQGHKIMLRALGRHQKAARAALGL